MDKAVVDPFERVILARRITPAKAVTDHEDNIADDPPVIDHPAHLRFRQPNQNAQGYASFTSPLNQLIINHGSSLIGPDPGVGNK